VATDFNNRVTASRRAFLLAVLVALLGTVLILQGWRSRIPNFDMLTTIDAAQQLIDHGTLPEKSVVTSFGSFTPPGLTWLMLPGVLFFRDPRLFEYIGSLFLYLGTLLGIFAISRRYFGLWCAAAAVAVYSLSELGMSLGSTLFHRYPTHFFFVWMVYCVSRWVDERRPVFLAAAVLVWAIGMNVFMEMAPAIILLPIVWFVYRPPVRLAPLLLVAALAAGVWYPYLRFEQGRQFTDLRSQVLRERGPVVDFAKAWCDPSLWPQEWVVASSGSAPNGELQKSRSSVAAIKGWASERVTVAAESLLANLRRFPVPGTGAVLFLLMLFGLAASFIANGRDMRPVAAPHEAWRQRLAWAAAGMVFLSLFLNEFLLARLLSTDGTLAPESVIVIRLGEMVLLVFGLIAFVWRDAITHGLRWVHRRLSEDAANTRVLALSLIVPWVFLFIIADAERRFWWMWPLQAILLAAAVTYVPARFRVPRLLTITAAVVVCLVVAANPMLLARLQSWADVGWAGQNAAEVEVVDRVNTLLRSQGASDETSIGYDIDTSQFMAAFNSIDPRYKVGADFDLIFKYRAGISNQDRCAEGFAPNDKYRIVQTASIQKYVGRDVAAQPTPGDTELGQNRIRPRVNEGDDRSVDDYVVASEVGAYRVLTRN
jgi:hypothetical protein